MSKPVSSCAATSAACRAAGSDERTIISMLAGGSVESCVTDSMLASASAMCCATWLRELILAVLFDLQGDPAALPVADDDWRAQRSAA
jgi:hypothetical protein